MIVSANPQYQAMSLFYISWRDWRLCRRLVMFKRIATPAAILLSSVPLLCVRLLPWVPFLSVSLFCLTLLCISIIIAISFPAVSPRSVGFFHPHADDGGGGERVLWSAIDAFQATQPHLKIILYARSGFTSQDLIARAAHNFGIRIESPIDVVHLSRVSWLNPDRYPHLTLLCQSLAALGVAWEGLGKTVPEVFVDTSGWAFCYPFVRMLGAKVACYVHYPTISSDMLQRVKQRHSLYNNESAIADSHVLSALKLGYYRIFAAVYGVAGKCANVTMVNSSWTLNHIKDIWGVDAAMVYPPVDTNALQQLSLERPEKPCSLISIAQFRPEKDHALQLKAFKKALVDAEKAHGEAFSHLLSSKFKIVGSCRNASDRMRLRQLREMVENLELQKHVEFFESIPVGELRELLGSATAGLHTMMDEHFGIGIVEYMAAGVIPIAHNSGGPKMDILTPPQSSSPDAPSVGFLCTNVDEYASAITKVVQLNEEERRRMAIECREKAQSFSQEKFQEAFCHAIHPLHKKAEL